MAICENCIHDKVCGLEGHLDEALTFCADRISDVQLVKRGHWKKDTEGYNVYIECSECGVSLSMSDYIENEWKEIMHYCPNCGARMENESKRR